jgi:parallel beta-helix repeat protein
MQIDSWIARQMAFEIERKRTIRNRNFRNVISSPRLPEGNMRPFVVSVALLAAGMPAAARSIVVRSGGSIRAAIAQAAPGDRIEVLPGTYREGARGDLNAVTITKPGLELVGLARPGAPVVLENAGDQAFGIWVSPASSAGEGPQSDVEHPPCGLSGTTLRGFVLRGFTVRGFAVHGVHLACVDGFSLTDNHADANGVYGLFPIVSSHGVLAGNVATKTQTDAAIYVGQSDDVLIAANSVHDNLLGIEVENSRNCAVVANEAYANTLGIFVDILPFLERGTQESTLVAYNSVHDNNRPNTAEPDDILGVLPSGLGVLVAGGRSTTVLMNDVRNNGFTGIAVASLCLGLALQGSDCGGLDIDPDPRDDRIVGNRLVRNGTAPQANPIFDALKADLVWDGSGTGNCWSANVFTSSTPAQLPPCR